MVRPRPALNRSRPQQEDLSKLSNEVLQLRLQALHLPFSGSKAQLVARLRKAVAGNSSTTTSKTRTGGKSSRVHKAKTRSSRSTATRTGIVAPDAQPAARTATPVHEREHEDSAQSDDDSSSSLDELFDDSGDTTAHTAEQSAFNPVQRAAIEAIVVESVSNAFAAFRSPERSAVTPQDIRSPRAHGTASPLGLSRPVDRNLENKILRGEYVDLALLLPETLYQSQAPAIQLRLDDSALGPLGSPVTMVRKRKPTIDTFHKWLDAYTAYMLVLLTAYPRRALELIKYQQIISRAVTKFKGMAWYSYDQQFRRRAAYDLSISWDIVDLELWTVTFSGLAKPHCNVCSSPYHIQDDCPSADPHRKLRRAPTTVCFDFNKPSGCRRRNCSYPHVCRRCNSSSHSATACPQQPASSASPSGSSKASDRSKK